MQSAEAMLLVRCSAGDVPCARIDRRRPAWIVHRDVCILNLMCLMQNNYAGSCGDEREGIFGFIVHCCENHLGWYQTLNVFDGSTILNKVLAAICDNARQYTTMK